MPESDLQEYGSRDPAPLAPERDAGALETRLMDYERPLFERFQAVFTLRGLGTPEAVDVLGRALRRDPSALLRHEVAFVFGQMGDVAAYPYLAEAATEDDHPMVRHEAVEAMGNLPAAEPDKLLVRIEREDVDREVRDSAELALANLAFLRDAQTL